MILTYFRQDWDRFPMDVRDPFKQLEPPANERAVVQTALDLLREFEILPHAVYDLDKFDAHRQSLHSLVDIKWTAITPRMQRVLYGINAVAQPANLIAAGVFWGYTFLCNAGAAVGPGACYEADTLIGVEINPEEAARAERNVSRIDSSGRARIVCADAVEVAADSAGPVDLLYLDADGAGGRGKAVYLDILQAVYDRIPKGGLVLAHNSVNCAEALSDYLGFVRDPAHFESSANLVVDTQGLEVSRK